MVQLNLIPDIKAEYIKSRKQKRFVMLLSGLVISVSLGITFLLAFVVYGVQGLRLSSLEKSIKENSSELQSTQGLDEILTIQNQLSALDTLHEQKPVATRIPAYFSQIVPVNTSLESVTVDLVGSTITLSGTTDSLQDVNKLVDTFKFVEITRGEEGELEGERQKAFSQVVLSSFDREPNNSTFSISMVFDPVIFSSAEEKIALLVPQTVTTRSTVEQPPKLFGNPESGEQ